jgi:hypothetical protein
MKDDPIKFRNDAARRLPAATGVYALCDLDEVPIYVGQSEDGIRARVRRHLTSARSDVIANRQLDVWEIAFVWAWPVAEKRRLTKNGKPTITAEERERIGLIEQILYHKYNTQSPLVNGTIVAEVSHTKQSSIQLPKQERIKVMPDEEIAARREPARRLPRQAEHFRSLLDHMLNVKNEEELRRALSAHFMRLQKYYMAFVKATNTVDTSGTGSNEEE